MANWGGGASGAASGAALGSSFGPWGTVAGGIIGGIGGLFGHKKSPDAGAIYAGSKGQRDAMYNRQYDQLGRIYDQDPNTFWGQNYGDWSNRTGIGGGGDPTGSFGAMGGFGGGGGGHATGYAAHAGHGNAEYIDIGAEPYQTTMQEAIRQGFTGRLRKSVGADVDSAVRRADASMGMAGLSPAARALAALRARTSGADTVGQQTQAFETDHYRNALQRQAEARGQNAQMGTNVSMGNAANDTQASIATAGNRTSASGVNAGIGAQRAGQNQALAAQREQMMLGLWDRNQDRDIDRYKTGHTMGQSLYTPMGMGQAPQNDFMGDLATGIAAGRAAFGKRGGGGGGSSSVGNGQYGNYSGGYPSGGQDPGSYGDFGYSGPYDNDYVTRR